MSTKSLFALTHKHFSTTASTRLNESSSVRVRFAPSPTGRMHLGGLRTAFYNYIFAKQNNGRFVLRIEDTDQTRVVAGAAEELERTLVWAGLRPDESPNIGGDYGPYYQSARKQLYIDRAHELLETGNAYRCFCSPERLDLLRKFQSRNRERIRYDSKCSFLSPSELKEKLDEHGDKHVIRFKLKAGVTSFEDMIFGQIGQNFDPLCDSDPVILKSDKFPTYHLANVVDDRSMKISHVLRGSEWIGSTGKHIQLYNAFGWQAPQFAHFPLITLTDGKKMSKRNEDSQVTDLQQRGYKPAALLNFITSMGGGLPHEKFTAQDLWHLDEMVEKFRFNQVVCSPGGIDLDKLRIYNTKELSGIWQEQPDKLVSELRSLLAGKTDRTDDELKSVLGAFIGRIVTVNELLVESNEFIWRQPSLSWDPGEYRRDRGWNLELIVSQVRNIVANHDHRDKTRLEAEFKRLAEEQAIQWSQFMALVRRLLTNNKQGLPVFEIFKCLGKQRLLQYLDKGLEYVTRP